MLVMKHLLNVWPGHGVQPGVAGATFIAVIVVNENDSTSIKLGYSRAFQFCAIYSSLTPTKFKSWLLPGLKRKLAAPSKIHR